MQRRFHIANLCEQHKTPCAHSAKLERWKMGNAFCLVCAEGHDLPDLPACFVASSFLPLAALLAGGRNSPRPVGVAPPTWYATCAAFISAVLKGPPAMTYSSDPSLTCNPGGAFMI